MLNTSETLPKNWTELTSEQKLDVMKDVSHADSTAAQIAEMVRRQYDYDISRNVVIGAVHRAGLSLPGFLPKSFARSAPRRTPRPRRSSTQPSQAKRRPSKTGDRLPPMKVETELKAPKSDPVAFIDLEDRHCKWPVAGEPGPNMKCCGAPTVLVGNNGLRHSYCKFHKALGTGAGTRSEQMAAKNGYVKPAQNDRAGVLA